MLVGGGTARGAHLARELREGDGAARVEEAPLLRERVRALLQAEDLELRGRQVQVDEKTECEACNPECDEVGGGDDSPGGTFSTARRRRRSGCAR